MSLRGLQEFFVWGLGFFKSVRFGLNSDWCLNSSLEEYRKLFVHKLGSGGWPHRWVLSLVAEALQSVGVFEFVAWNLTSWGLKISSAGLSSN